MNQEFMDFRYRQIVNRRRNLRRIGAAMFAVYGAMAVALIYMGGR